MSRCRDLPLNERETLWRMGERWLAEGTIDTALDVFWRILEKFPGTVEGEKAKAEIRNLAKKLGAQGLSREAMGLHEQLAARG
ncbi:MAG: hypothetical protein ACE5LX_00360 [Nitrospinota bacterium]